ncbi:hypothetical protein N792_06245 [Lysobacter concretionis Ko07 = DSM 16239]|jgi:hypothetical protein|uniref:Lipoprotein n=1 Tax=Lysobacter concretionis Ko07 = DSM 16239 TaxID=1122185 RepID=A0A0A0ELT0_9GAMM|nr:MULTISPECIES: hypothetical protein [Lysobacter]KGM51946.1 hypothetical protein N792_06245 [Lysobacter concretionis Ko07 = DSM 16239]QOD90314.1 hypothetical protein H2514_08745 [Lysobacter sp. CW239]
MSRALLAILLLGAALPFPSGAASPAGGFDLFASDDGDDTSVLRTNLTAYYRYDHPGQYRGLAVERARIRPLGTDGWSENRVYFRFADAAGDWKWNGQIGSNGHTLLGNASIVRDIPRRQEYFIEREVVETRQGEQGLHATFAGAAIDLPLDAEQRRQLTLLAGMQTFTGDNVRAHLRATYSAQLVREWGLSAQLRTRAFHSSHPGEADYYSPRWFAEAIPMLRLRRFHQGWMMAAGAGVGMQRDSNSDARAARLVEATIESPKTPRHWYLRANGTYSNTPVGEGINYGYRQINVQLIRPF